MLRDFQLEALDLKTSLKRAEVGAQFHVETVVASTSIGVHPFFIHFSSISISISVRFHSFPYHSISIFQSISRTSILDQAEYAAVRNSEWLRYLRNLHDASDLEVLPASSKAPAVRSLDVCDRIWAHWRAGKDGS